VGRRGDTVDCFHRGPIRVMAEETRESNKIQLAVALAQGSSISAWARANNVAKETARRWAREPEVRAEIEALRRDAIDRAVSVFARRAGWAANGICKLASRAESESVKFRALRAVLGDMMAVSKFSGLDERMSELEEFVRKQQGGGTTQFSDVKS
jgi:hypothetical protein